MGFEYFSDKLIKSRVTHSSRYTTVRAKLAVSRLICNITKLVKQQKLSISNYDNSIMWGGEKWMRINAKYSHPISLFMVDSCIRESAEQAISARLGLRVRPSFYAGFAYSKYNGGTDEALLFYNIAKYIRHKLELKPVFNTGLPVSMIEYIDAQWDKVYVAAFGNVAN